MFGKTGQVAEFYEVPIKTVESALKCHRSEFVTLKSKVTNKTRHITIWNPRSTLMRSPNLEAVTGLNFKVANKAQNLTVRTAN
jgi:hypothetical protein